MKLHYPTYRKQNLCGQGTRNFPKMRPVRQQDGTTQMQIADVDVSCKLCRKAINDLRPVRKKAGKSWPPSWARAS